MHRATTVRVQKRYFAFHAFLYLAAIYIFVSPDTWRSDLAAAQAPSAKNEEPQADAPVDSLDKAIAAANQGSWEEALRYFTLAGEQAPQAQKAGITYNRAACMYELRRFTEAERVFRRAAKMQKAQTTAMFLRWEHLLIDALGMDALASGWVGSVDVGW